MITWRAFSPADTGAVAALVSTIQRAEYGLDVTLADQPDLLDIPGHYGRGCGGFWVADADGRPVGTLGLLDIGGGNAALRKMFVDVAWRGRGHDVARGLLGRALAHAGRHRLQALWLGTTEVFTAAHRFYEREGFVRIAPEALPAAFPRMAVDTRFYTLPLNHNPAVPC